MKNNEINKTNDFFFKEKEKTILPKLIKIKKFTINDYNNSNTKSISQIKSQYKKISENNKNNSRYKVYQKIMDSLNQSLYLNDSIKQLKHNFTKINIKTKFNPKLLDEIKKEKYNKKWNFNNIYNENKVLSISGNKKLEQKGKNKKLIKNKKYNSNFNKEYTFLNKIKTTNKLLSPKQIVKICKRNLYDSNDLMKYSLYLNNNIDYYIESQENNSEFYEFDKQLRNMIKESKIGIEFPGNTLKRNVLCYIKTFNPKSITSKHTKNYSVPDRTFIPIPEGLIGTKFSHITMEDEYNYRKLII